MNYLQNQTVIHHLGETIIINWLLLLAPFLFLTGVAILLAMLVLAGYRYPGKGQWANRKAFFMQPLAKLFWLGAVGLLVISPILYSLKLDSGQLIVTRVKEPRPGTRFIPIFSGHTFSTMELRIDPQNGSHKQNKKNLEPGPIYLFWDGYVRTPFLSLAPGHYLLTFQAAGSFAQDAFSKIKVEFQTPDNHRYLVTRKKVYFELSQQANLYHMTFSTAQEIIGRINITFFNDLYLPETRQGRDVFLEDIAVYAVQK